MTKRNIFLLIIIVIIFNAIKIEPIFANQNVDVNNHIDAVLVMDTSNSMNGNDPNHIAIEGVKLFIDMMENSGSRVSIIGFNGEITFKTQLVNIDSQEDKIRILKDLDDIKYTGYTDMGLALKEAESILFNQKKETNKPMIVMFTDGYVEVKPNANRTEKQSKEEIEQVILGAKGNYPIYTVGLNNRDRVDKALIEKIAEQTYAKSYMTKDPKDLPEIFNDIFARHIKSKIIDLGTIVGDGESYKKVEINIPNASVVEANIIIYSDKEILDARIENPNKQSYDFSNNKNIYISKSNKYSVIKIIEPEQGIWNFYIKGVKDEQIKVNLLYNYDISVELFTDNNNYKKGELIKLKGRIINKKSSVSDSSLVNAFNAELSVKEQDSDLIEKIPMKLNGDVFETDFQLPNENKVLIFTMQAAGSGFYRESQELIINIANTPPSLVEKVDNKILFYLPPLITKMEIDATKIFIDEDDSDIKYLVGRNNEDIEISEDNNILTVVSKGFMKFGKTEVLLKATDFSGGSAETKFIVSTVPIMAIILILAVFVILIIFSPNFIKSLNESSKFFKGNIKTIIVKEGIHGLPKHTNLSSSKGRKSVVDFVNEEELSGLSELDKIVFVQADGKYALEFKNNSKYEIYTTTKLGKNFSLEQNINLYIKNKEENIDIIINYYL